VLFEHTHDVVDELAEFLGIKHSGPPKMDAINQNSSPDDIEIPTEAREIAERHLSDVESKVRSVISADMIVGNTFSLA
jgi:hypothetical protein